ncbi:hypothetical protein [Streptomyces plumbiresistens]|uniref:Uncharacterized protein n=1 Tax=Streptomyces plumbiresistens TaxID=511811 RepID=A0ABP7TEM3_9ACTN
MPTTVSTVKPGTPFLRAVRVLDVTGAPVDPCPATILSGVAADALEIEPVPDDRMRATTSSPRPTAA